MGSKDLKETLRIEETAAWGVGRGQAPNFPPTKLSRTTSYRKRRKWDSCIRLRMRKSLFTNGTWWVVKNRAGLQKCIRKMGQ